MSQYSNHAQPNEPIFDTFDPTDLNHWAPEDQAEYERWLDACREEDEVPVGLPPNETTAHDLRLNFLRALAVFGLTEAEAKELAELERVPAESDHGDSVENLQ
jgi:hypothetical protein